MENISGKFGIYNSDGSLYKEFDNINPFWYSEPNNEAITLKMPVSLQPKYDIKFPSVGSMINLHGKSFKISEIISESEFKIYPADLKKV